MAIVVKYRFNPQTYENLLPQFNSGYTSYTVSDVTNHDGTITRTIESSTLPTLMRFGTTAQTVTDSSRYDALLEIYEINCSNLTDMNAMFRVCSNLKYLDLSDQDLSKVTNMPYVFAGCASLKYVDLSNTNTINNGNLQSIFVDCPKLKSIKLKNFRTDKVTNMNYMFNGCTSLKSLDVSSFNTENVTSMSSMFKNCELLTSLDLSGFDTKNVTILGSMFHGCKNLTSLDLLHFNTSKVTNMSYTFYFCNSLKTLKISNWDTSKVTNFSFMFQECIALEELNIARWDTPSATSMQYMFTSCSSLTSLDVSRWDVSKVENMKGIFSKMSKITTLDLTRWNTESLINMESTFSYMTNLQYLDLENWNVSKVTTMNSTFQDCQQLTDLKVSTWDVSSVTTVNNIFGNCKKLENVDVSKWDVSNIENLAGMFSNCSALEKIDLTNFSTTSATTMGYMFSNCSKLKEIKVSNFTTNLVTNMQQMFYNCFSLTSLNLTSFNTDRVENSHAMLTSLPNTATVYLNQSTTSTLDTSSYSCNIIKLNGQMVAHYKFNSTINNNLLPIFNAEFTDYTITDFNETDGTTRRIISANTLPTSFIFTTGAISSLLEIYNVNGNLTSTDSMFAGCQTVVKISTDFTLKNVTSMANMFNNCASLQSVDVSAYDTKNVTSTYACFKGCIKLLELDVSKWNLEQCTVTGVMFQDCQGLETLDISNWNVGNITNMNSMFQGCQSLTNLDVSNWDTQNLIYASNLFRQTKLTSLNLNKWNVEKIRNMDSMFRDCTELETLHISSWNTNSVRFLNNMFTGCSKLTKIDVSNFNTTQVENFAHMFNNCTSLELLDLTSFDTSLAVGEDYVGGIFNNCTSDLRVFTNSNTWTIDMSSYSVTHNSVNGRLVAIVTVDGTNYSDYRPICEDGFTLGRYANINKGDNKWMRIFTASTLPTSIMFGQKWVDEQTDTDTTDRVQSLLEVNFVNVNNLTTMEGMFRRNSNLTKIDFYGTTKNVTNMFGTFASIDSLNYIDLSNFNTKLVTNMSNMFSYCKGLKQLDVSHFDTQNVEDMSVMFNYCQSIKELDLSQWNTENVTKMERMFMDCKQLQSMDLSNFNMEKVTNITSLFHNNNQIQSVKFPIVKSSALTSIRSAFANCGSLTEIDFTPLNTSSVTDMSVSCSGCSIIKTINMDGMDVSKVLNTDQTFRNCHRLTDLRIGGWKTDSLKYMGGMFWGCEDIEYLDIANWNVSKVTNMSSLFRECKNLKQVDVSKWQTDSVDNISYMFATCENLESINVSNFNVSKVNNMECMFTQCRKLKKLDLSKWNTSKVSYMNHLFSYCTSLESVDVSGFDTSSLSHTINMFRNCTSLKVIDLTSLTSEKFTQTNDMFTGLTSDQVVYVNANTWTLDTSTYDVNVVPVAGRLIASYKFNSKKYADYLPNFNSDFANAYNVYDNEIPDVITVDSSTWNLGALNTETGAEIASSTNFLSDYIEITNNVYYLFSDSVALCWYTNNKVFISSNPGATQSTAPENAKYIRVFRSTRPTTFTLTTSGVIIRAISSNYTPNTIYFGQPWVDTETEEAGKPRINSLMEVYTAKLDGLSSLYAMFRGCYNLRKIKINFGQTNNIVATNNMFEHCSNLQSVDLSNLDVSNITTMANMFCYCYKLQDVGDLSNWNLEKTTSIQGMFMDCQSITSFDFVKDWDVRNVQSMSNMFNNCFSITSLDLTNWNPKSVTQLNGMFNNANKLETLDVSGWNTYKVTTLEQTFSNLVSLTNLDIDGWNTTSVQIMNRTFASCKLLTSLDLSSWQTPNLNNLFNTFHDCNSLTLLDISHWDLRKVNIMQTTFGSCDNLTTFIAPNLDVSNCTDFRWCFSACPKLENLDVSNWNFSTNSNINAEAMFQNCKSLKEIDLSNWNTIKFRKTNNMFHNCTSLVSVNLSNWKTSNVNDMHSMFEGCSSLVELDLSWFDTNNVTNFTGMFQDCTNLEILDISNFHFGGVNQNPGQYMFYRDTNLKHIGMIYCRASSFNSLQSAFNNLVATPVNVYYHDASLSDLTTHANVTYVYYDKSTATLPYELNKLPNGVADYIDVVNGVYVQRVGKQVFNGSENWGIETNPNSTSGWGTVNDENHITFISTALSSLQEMSGTYVCDKFTYVEYDGGNKFKPNGNMVAITDGGGYNRTIVRVATSIATTADDFKTWLSNNPMTVLYQLKTPIYTPLTDEEKALLPLSAYSNGYVQLSSDELRPSKFEFRTKSNNRLQLDMLETGYYYLNAPTGNVKLGNVDVNVTEMPCLIKVDNASNNRLVVNAADFFCKDIPLNYEEGYLNVGNGTVSTEYVNGRWVSDFVEIPYYDKYIYIMNDTELVDICYYDENKNFTSGVAIGKVKSGQAHWLTGNTAAKYMRFSGKNSERVLSLRSHVITLSKLPSHRIPTTFTQGMKSSVNFGYWQGVKEAKASYVRTINPTDWIEISRINFGNGIELNRITGHHAGTRVTVEDEIDISTGKYTKRVGKYVIDGTVTPYSSLEHEEKYNIQKVVFLSSKTGIKAKNQWNNGSYGLAITDSLKFDVNYGMNEPHIFMATGNITLYFKAGTFGAFTLENVQNYFKENPMTVYYELETPEIVYLDLTDYKTKTVDTSTVLQGQRYSVDYLYPQIKPSPLSYPTTLSPNTQYTVFHNRKNYNGSVKTPMINLGGTEVAATGTRTVVTTPSTLVHNELQFIGGENTVEQVMVLHGDWTKEGKTVDYFEGLQSSVIGDKTLENLVDEPIEIWSNNVTDVSNGGAVDYVSINDVVAGYGNRPKLPEVQVDTNVRSYGMTLKNLAVEHECITEPNAFVRTAVYDGVLPIGTYIFFYNVIEPNPTTQDGGGERFTPYYTCQDGSSYYEGWETHNQTTGLKYWKFTVTSPITMFRFWIANIDASCSANNFMLLQYQEGMENWDIPFFEGMKSVENPVYHSVGKNLFDASKWINGRPAPYSDSSINQIENTQNSATPIIKCKPNTTYTISRILPDNSTTYWYALYGYNKDGFKVQHIVDNQYVGEYTFTTNNDVYYLRGKTDNPYEVGKNELWQIEEGSIATSYEPYKENILSTAQGTVLRSVGSYKDVIGWNDGIIRRNCVEFTITGEEGYSISGITENTNTIMCNISWGVLGLENKILTHDGINMVICDKLPSRVDNEDTPHIRQDGGLPYSGSLMFWFDKTKFSTYTSQGINDYIKSIGGLTIVAPLANTEYENVTFTNDYSNVDEEYQVGKPLIFNHGTLYTTTDTHPSTFLDFSLKTTNRYTVKDFDKLKYTVLTEQPFYFNGVDYPTSSTGMTIIDVTGIADSSIYSDDTMITVVQDDGNYYADGVLTQFKGEKTFVKEFIRTSNDTYSTGITLLEPLVLNGLPNGVRDNYNPTTGEIIRNIGVIDVIPENLQGFENNGVTSKAYLYDTRLKDRNTAQIAALGVLSNNFSPIDNASVYTYGVVGATNNFPVWFSLENTITTLEDFQLWFREHPQILLYQLATPQIIQATPTSTYISTRPENGNIIAQDTQIQAEYLNYDNEQSIISPRMLSDGDEIRWELGSQCYVYENDNEYIPLTEHNELFGANLQAQEYTQYAESVDGADIEVGVALKEKAVYEQTYVKYEDNVIYPETMENIDETNGVEVDYICGATWQNPNDLSDIRHLGELREDGQYDVTIRRSGDDEIRLLESTTHIGLDYDVLPPSEFELTFFNNGGVEVGKYGDTTHVLEDCVGNSKLASGTIYGQTLNNLHKKQKYTQYIHNVYKTNCTITEEVNNITVTVNKDFTNSSEVGSFVLFAGDFTQELKPSTKYLIVGDIENMTHVSIRTGDSKIIACNDTVIINSRYAIITTRDSWSETNENKLRILFTLITKPQNKTYSVKNVMMFEYQDGMENHLPTTYFEQGMGSTVVNGFSSCGKNLIYGSTTGTMQDNGLTWTWDNGIITLNGQKTDDDSYLYLRDGRLNIHNIPNNGEYSLSHRIISGEIDTTDCRLGTTYGQMTLTDGTNTHGLQLYGDNPNYTNENKTFNNNLPNNMDKCWFRIHQGAKFNNLKIQFQLERSSVHTAFEEPKIINYTLPTPITLRKVGDVCDTFDVVSGVYTKNVDSINLCGENELSNTVITSGVNGTFDLSPNTINKYSSVLKTLASNTVYLEVENIVIANKNGSSHLKVEITYNENITAETQLGYQDYFNSVFASNPTILLFPTTPTTTQHTLIPSTTQTMLEPTFILPQLLRSVPNGICDRLYWDENKGHYCIEKRIGKLVLDDTIPNINHGGYSNTDYVEIYMPFTTGALIENVGYCEDGSFTMNPYVNVSYKNSVNYKAFAISTHKAGLIVSRNEISEVIGETYTNSNQLKTYLSLKPVTLLIPLATPEIIDLPYLDEKVELPTQPNIYPIGYKAIHEKANPKLGLTIPYKVLNMPTQPTNLNFVMDIADYVLTWDDVKEARQYNIILNDEVIATVKEPQYNTGEEMYGYILVEANNEIGDNLSEELYIKTVPNAPAQLTVAHNPQTDYYDFEISFIDTSDIADYYTVMYKVDGGEWVINTIQNSELTTGEKHLWSFSVYEIKESIEVWATATNDVGTNDILPTAIYYMSPTPQWTYRINSKDVFLRWLDESPYDTKYKLRYSYKSNGQYQYAYFEGDAAEIGKLYEAVLPLAEDDEVTLALCIVSEKENLYCKPVKASKPLDPNIVPPTNFNYHWLARGLIEFYWEDQYDVDVEYEYILESMKANETLWTQVNEIVPSEDVEGTGTIYRVEYQLEDLEQIRMKVRMKWAMNETEWTETLTTVFIPVEGNPPTYIRRTQTAEGLLVEWEAQAYIDSYHIYVIDNETGEELQHLETSDNSILVDLDYSNSIEIAIYEISRFSGGIESDPTDPMVFTPTMFATDIDQRIYQPCAEEYPIEISTVQKGNKQAYVIHDVSYTPNVETEHEIGVSIATPFTISYHPMMVDVHQAGSRSEATINAHIKTLNTRNEDLIRVMTFERITDVYDMDFRVYTPSVASYPINLEVSKVRIVCLGDSLTSGHPFYWD